MAWRQQKSTSANSNSDKSENRFDKFFSKKTNSSEPRFTNKKYDRSFSIETASTESASEKKSYHEGFDPTLDNEMRNRRFQNRSNNFRSEDRSRFNNKRGNFNSDRRAQYNSDFKSNVCRSFQKYGNCRFGDSCKFSHQNTESTPDPVPQIKTCGAQISTIQELLDSGKYISKSKKEELEQEILDLKEKQKKEFPELKSIGIHVPAPAPVLKASCWGNIANSKVLSTEGIEEANKRVKARKVAEEEEKKQEQKKVYDEHVESDYDGDDFFNDDDSLNDEDYYDEQEYSDRDL